MIPRFGWPGGALLAMLAASPCLAQDAPAPASDEPVPIVRSLAGRGGIGGLIGGSFFYASEEYSQGALPRFDFSGHFRYVFTPGIRAQVSPGLTWSAYSKEEPPPFTDIASPGDRSKEDYLALLAPVSAQLQFTWRSGLWVYHAGAGPGLYRVWVQNHRRVLRDPVSHRLHRGVYLGGTGQVGVERFLKALPSTSIEVSLSNHYVSAVRDDQFPTGWNSNLGAFALRAGVSYYFDLDRSKRTPELPLPVEAR